MHKKSQYQELLFQSEVLRSRLIIREYFSNNIEKEIYESTGQELSLIRIQLSLVLLELEIDDKVRIKYSIDLVAKIIRDLRRICQMLYPDLNTNFKQFITSTLEQDIKLQYPAAEFEMWDKYRTKTGIINNSGIIIFGSLIEIVKIIGERQGTKINAVRIAFYQRKLSISIKYKDGQIGKVLESVCHDIFNPLIFERVRIGGGKLAIKRYRAGVRMLKLESPIN